MNDDVGLRPGRRNIWALFGLIVLSLLLLATVVAAFLLFKGPTPIDVGLRFSAGDTLRFHMVVNVSGVSLSGTSPTPSEDEIQADVTWRVVKVDANGAATVVQTLTHPSMRSNGAPVPLAQLRSTTLTIGTDGQVGAASGLSLFAGSAPGPAQAGIARPVAFLPDHDVRIRDTWTTQVMQPFWGSSFDYQAISTFLRREQLAGVDAAVIESDATVPVDLTVKVADVAEVLVPSGLIPTGSTAAFSGSLKDTSTTSWIDPATGSLLKTVSRGNFALDLTLHGFPKAALAGNGRGILSGQLSMQLTRV